MQGRDRNDIFDILDIHAEQNEIEMSRSYVLIEIENAIRQWCAVAATDTLMSKNLLASH